MQKRPELGLNHDPKARKTKKPFTEQPTQWMRQSGKGFFIFVSALFSFPRQTYVGNCSLKRTSPAFSRRMSGMPNFIIARRVNPAPNANPL